MNTVLPSAKTLVNRRVASRLHAKDDSLFAFSDEAQQCAHDFMGWVDVATSNLTDLDAVQSFARQAHADGINTVVLIGQGGSTQAPMTITKYNKADSKSVTFKTLDSDSPVRVREALSVAQPAHSLVVVSSKSGSTIEPRVMFSVVRRAFEDALGKEAPKHFVAITDPGSVLETQAIEEGWRAVFNGEPTIGGRFSALSIFGLLPAALVGIDLHDSMAHAKAAEIACSEDAIDNPAIGLAAFLYDNYKAGRNKFCFLTPKRGRVLGLWIEQLVAESLGKNGEGILPNIEVDSLMLKHDPKDRCAVVYQTENDSWDEVKNYEMSLAYIDSRIPRMCYKISSVQELAEHFVMWEYAIAMCGHLMSICPFDQPDVASAKAATLDILRDGKPTPDFTLDCVAGIPIGQVEVRLSPALPAAKTLYDALYALLSSIQEGDYFACNVFLPYTGEFRREALEEIRHGVGKELGVVSSLEVGPRYLHSTGQLQKGGPNIGVFLLISADEMKDIPVQGEPESLGDLAKSQCIGDFVTLSRKGRRCMHVHLPDNSGVTLRVLAEEVRAVLAQLTVERSALGQHSGGKQVSDTHE